ncbi:zinc finger protein 484-like [Cydia splendana]|uniref:zinc finger protein 484-like n=1 Tax=Cydia splendana TaxID=1100963 RepID=UPI0028F48CD6
MDEICRLCCSTKFVNNHLFDEENALYLKMSLFLPIKVVRSDRLPQRVCDRCSCRVNDLYQFCNETIEVQHRLRAILQSSGLPVDDIDLTLVKDSSRCEASTQTEPLTPPPRTPPNPPVKQEPELETQVKVEADEHVYEDGACVPSDNSDDLSLVSLKKKKRVKQELQGAEKRGRKRKKQLKEWNLLMGQLPPELSLEPVVVKQEPQDIAGDLLVKREPDDDKFDCCICFAQCCSRGEMLQHYRQHGAAAGREAAPAAPPAPGSRPLRCPRCSKIMEADAWAAHWLRHWERDRRPYRCARCEKTFRDHHQILKHGLTHKGEAEGETPGKRFVCDLCPEGFVYMRYLLAHRTRAHPEAAARALALRCATCAREFAHLNSLRRHLRAHSGERNFLCSVCGKALSSREHLKFHLRIHAGYKPNVCGTCGKGFVKKCNLTLHERVHSGEKPHVCSHCGKAFSQRSTLVIHERYHSGARPYVCALCGRGFVAKGLLSMHLKTTCI